MDQPAQADFSAEDVALLDTLRRSGSVFAEEELAELRSAADAADDLEVLPVWVDRRSLGEPIEHITGRARFAELRVAVHSGVFVPRHRTELLATIVADRLRELAAARTDGPAPRLLDLGCGTGAIAALAVHRVPGIEVVAIDADPAAVACARVNLPGALVVHADRIDALDVIYPRAIVPGAPTASAPFDVIAANLPYVPTDQLALLPHDTLEHESLLALDGGAHGLDPLAEHADAMANHLRDGGIAVTEVAPHQVELAIEILERAGFSRVEVRSDDELGATALVAAR